MMRHSIDVETCVEGNYKVKSNMLDGIAFGAAADAAGDYGWATVSGKATFRDMTEYNTGGNAFLLYVEDHGEQGCSQDPSDEIWIEILADNVWIDPLPDDPANEDGSDSLSDQPIECGNIVVPQKSKGGKGKPDK